MFGYRSLIPLSVLLLLGLGSSLANQETAPAPPALPEDTADSVRIQQSPDHDADANAEYEFLRRLYEGNVGKRAYSYVSEYKRLPVYNFGLGKRSPSQLYGFGLGKRASPNRLYSFGLGKRDFEDDYSEEEVDNEPDMSEEDDDDEVLAEKRNRLYSFGLGKRMSPYGFGLGKRNPSNSQRLYGFGLGKRASPSMYSFGLGKRAESRLYSFGLGKRPSSNRNTRFSFGLGKRSGEGIGDNDLDEVKRYGADHRFSFGLGKREVSADDLEEVSKETKKENRTAAQHTIAKRSLHYGFGLGKRSQFEFQDGQEQFDGSTDLARFARRPYSFGLGKRVPMYDFGIGKRSEV